MHRMATQELVWLLLKAVCEALEKWEGVFIQSKPSAVFSAKQLILDKARPGEPVFAGESMPPFNN